MEKVTLRTDRDDPSPAELKGYFAEVFASLDANPRRMLLTVDVRNDRRTRFEIDLEKGEPVFRAEGHPSVRANFRGRWLAEHPVPLALPRFGTMKLLLEPTTANRVKVRRAPLLRRLLPW